MFSGALYPGESGAKSLSLFDQNTVEWVISPVHSFHNVQLLTTTQLIT